jgi:hypothetical protein
MGWKYLKNKKFSISLPLFINLVQYLIENYSFLLYYKILEFLSLWISSFLFFSLCYFLLQFSDLFTNIVQIRYFEGIILSGGLFCIICVLFILFLFVRFLFWTLILPLIFIFGNFKLFLSLFTCTFFILVWQSCFFISSLDQLLFLS